MSPQSGTLKTLIVDDEPIARQILREELRWFPEVEIVGEAQDGREALERISDTHPDLVLLDLQMPVMGGFEVVRSLGGERLPVVVIVTAFDQHAIQAFEAGAIDYLLKPVGEERLRKAVERAQELRSKPLQLANYTAKISSAGVARKVVGRIGAEYLLLDPNEILAFQADGELVWIVTAKQRLLATQTLRQIEKRFSEQQFQRIHRNAIVNVNHVRKMTPITSQRWLITLSNSAQVVASKRQAHRIRGMLHG